MSRKIVQYISELFGATYCDCGSGYIRSFISYIYESPAHFCCKCLPKDIIYPKLYVYYEGVTGYITLYGDIEESLNLRYHIDSHSIINNLHEAKTKRKL